jgi:hypothetical protein
MLSRSQRQALGIARPVSYAQVERTALKVDRSARDGVDIPDPHHPGETLRLTTDMVMSLICAAAIPPNLVTTATVAADGTDFETPARPDGWVDKTTGEIHDCADPDAVVGHRTATPNHPSKWFRGQEVTVLTNAPDRAVRTRPAAAAPTVVLAAGIRGASCDRGGVCASLILWWHHKHAVREALVDRGISQVADESLARPLRDAGIEMVIDLKAQERRATPPTPIPTAPASSMAACSWRGRPRPSTPTCPCPRSAIPKQSGSGSTSFTTGSSRVRVSP